MSDSILVINAGSSSIKFSLFARSDGTLGQVLEGQIDGIGNTPRFKAKDADGAVIGERRFDHGAHIGHEELFRFLLVWIESRPGCGPLRAAGHRVVHGGRRYSTPVVVDDAILSVLDTFVPLAPLHQPHNLAPIRVLAKLYPGLPQVACFDTAFHRTNPPLSQLFALPRTLTEEGIRRYGFHGLSYEYIARQLPEHDPAAAQGRTVVAHLGNGSSMCALGAGRSVTSSMGFTAVDGLMMGTRTGTLDPGVVLYLMREKGMKPNEIETLLYKKSGLIGVSGLSNDMRELLASDDPHAREAIDLFVYRVNRELGGQVAVLGGIDALVFTAGIGENAAEIRARICGLAGWCGVVLDEAANRRHGPLISSPESRVRVWVIPTDEELMIAQHTQSCLRGL